MKSFKHHYFYYPFFMLLTVFFLFFLDICFYLLPLTYVFIISYGYPYVNVFYYFFFLLLVIFLRNSLRISVKSSFMVLNDRGLPLFVTKIFRSAMKRSNVANPTFGSTPMSPSMNISKRSISNTSLFR